MEVMTNAKEGTNASLDIGPEAFTHSFIQSLPW